MLKLELRAKIGALAPNWINSENLLTAHVFGTLDYLPRPCLHSLLRLVSQNSPHKKQLLTSVDWLNVQFHFWHLASTGGSSLPTKYAVNAEPDLVLISNRWVIVVECKLDAGFGPQQPLREFQLAQKLAAQNNLRHAYYLVVSKNQLDVASTFPANSSRARRKIHAALRHRTFYLHWSDIYRLVDSWLAQSPAPPLASPESKRLARDLIQSLRLRPALTFSGFSSLKPETPPPKS